jgi:L-fuconolactonase
VVALLCYCLGAGIHGADDGAALPIVDCHVHFWDLSRPAGITWIAKDNQTLYRSLLPPFHEPLAKANGIQAVVVVQAGQSLPDNQWNLDITAHSPQFYRGVIGNLSPVIGTDAFRPLFEELCRDARYLGFRLSGRYQDTLTDAFFRDLQLTVARGRVIDVLAGGYSLADVAEIARRVPDLRIMLNHCGNLQLNGEPLDPTWVAQLRALAKHPQVYCKVSALFGRVKQQPAPRDLAFYRPILDLVFECFGEDRLVFGSDWPVSETSGDYASVLALTRSYFDLRGRGVLDKLFHGNQARFYRITDGDGDRR